MTSAPRRHRDLHLRKIPSRQQPHQVTQPPKATRPQHWAAAGIVGAFCVLFFVLAYTHARGTSATYDETAHLPSGYSYLLWGDYRINPEHPPLAKMLAALPIVGFHGWPSRMDLTADDLAPGATPISMLAAKQAWALALMNTDFQWLFGHHLLYGPRDEALKRLQVIDVLKVPTTARLARDDFLVDADQVLLRGRIPMMLLGALLAILIFCWARDLYGLAGGTLAIAWYCLDPNFIAHSGLVTTDVAVTAFMFGAVYLLWRTCQRLTPIHAILTMIFVALAFATKFSAILLLPIFLLLGIARIFSRDDWAGLPETRFGLQSRFSKAIAYAALTAASLAAAYCFVWAVYGFRFSAAADPANAVAGEKLAMSSVNREIPLQPWRTPGHLPIESVVRNTAATKALLKYWPHGVPAALIEKAMPSAPLGFTERLILFAQSNHLLPEAFLYGFAHAHMKSLMRSSFLMGDYSDRGFSTYFFWAFLFKTPLVTIGGILAALYFAWKRRNFRRSHLLFLVVPAGLYFLVSIISNLNIGHRHLLPMYPFMFVLCGGLTLEWARWPLRKRQVIAFIALGVIAISSFVVFAPPWRPALVFPHYLAYFNELSGGPRNGYHALVDSNLDWGQDLKKLGEWLRDRHIEEPINLCYFGTAAPLYYQIPHINMPGGYSFEPTVSFGDAKIPGYLAISATNRIGAYFSPQEREAWQALLHQATLVDTIGYSILIYHLEKPSP